MSMDPRQLTGPGPPPEMRAGMSPQQGARSRRGNLGPGQNALEQFKPFEQMTERELVALSDEWFERVTSSRRHVERWALLATAFYMDQQYVDFYQAANAGTMLTQLPAKKGRVRTIDNVIEPAIRNELARLLRNRPHGVVVPESLDGEDYEAAHAGQDLIEHITREHRLEEYYQEATLWKLFGGVSLLDTQWDPTAGPPRQDGMGGAPESMMHDPDVLTHTEGLPPEALPPEMQNAAGQFGGNGAGGVAGTMPQGEGDFEFRVLSCFEFGVPHIRKRDIQEQPYVMITRAYELEEIYDRWGIVVEPDSGQRYGLLDERLTQILLGGMQPERLPKGTSAPKIPTAIVKETWIRPSVRAPQGLVLITAGGQVLDLQTWPHYLQGKYPFAKLEFSQVPGSFWSKGMVQSLIPLQRRINRATSVQVEQLNLRASVSTAVPRGTNVRSAMGGKATLYEMPPGATQPAHTITAPEVGDVVLREIEMAKASVSDITFQHEVSRGTTPPNVRSGTAINALKEMDDAASSIPLRSIERAVEHQGNLILRMARDLWDEPRLVQVLGDDGDIERRSFIRGGDLGGQFYVQPGSAWPFSKAEREQAVYQALEWQLIDQREATQVLEMGGLRRVFNERHIDMRHARRENQRFEELSAVNDLGQVDLQMFAQQLEFLRPADWHNHEVHIEMHNRVRKSPQYERWPTYRKFAFEAHIMAHQAALYAQMVAQQTAEGNPENHPDVRQAREATEEAEQAAQRAAGQEYAPTPDDAAPAGDEPLPPEGEEL